VPGLDDGGATGTSISRLRIRPCGESPDFGAQQNREPQVEVLVMGLELLRRVLPRMGPYLLLEILLPGGTLVALLLYLYRRRNPSITQDLHPRSAMASAPVLAPGRGSTV
jgi:hypothetical protein